LNLEAVREVAASPLKSALLGAAVLLATENGFTIKEIARQLGIAKGRLRRYSDQARDRRLRDPRAHLVYAAAIESGCGCGRMFKVRYRYEGGAPKAIRQPLIICLDCLRSSWADHPALRIHPDEMPKPEPSKAYQPGPLKGGVG
jgi:hypothetical protein